MSSPPRLSSMRTESSGAASGVSAVSGVSAEGQGGGKEPSHSSDASAAHRLHHTSRTRNVACHVLERKLASCRLFRAVYYGQAQCLRTSEAQAVERPDARNRS